ncbi:MAG: hypothetical protein CL940_01300 [Deltaproteobacteria bacterium]|nr:hypothetical protein [Deltaproteobacteria bacterium]
MKTSRALACLALCLWLATGCGGDESGGAASGADVVEPALDVAEDSGGVVTWGDTGDSGSAPDPDGVLRSDAQPVDPYEGLVIEPSATCQISGAPEAPPELALTQVLSGLSLTKPVDFKAGPEGSGRVFIVTQPGRVYMADAITPQGGGQLWLDLTGKVDDGPNEGGLLAMAFAPDFVSSGHVFFVSTRTLAGGFATVVTRVTVPDPPFGAPDLSSEMLVLVASQPYSNHNGGGLAFGPDGYLYVGLGDGGSAKDPLGHGQNLATWLGAMLRIDVSTLDLTGSYSIPPDNPFLGTPGAAPEIWAYGLRNPWRYSFDPVGGTLWAGDVGQNKVEEIDILVAGGNYGWKIMEGSLCFSPAFGCDTEGLELPVSEYPNPAEGKSVTGGVVYRGSAIPSLYGTYLFADYSYGTVWGLSPGEEEDTWERTTLLESGAYVSTFGTDSEGEVYLLDWWGGGVYRLVLNDPDAVGAPGWPARLSETGCFSDLASRTLAQGVYPYEVNAPLWSDGAAKERAFSLPAGTAIAYHPTEAWTLPIGSVLLKTFVRPGGSDALETRIMVRREDRWRSATYLWNDAGDDAELLNTGVDEDLGEQVWRYPSRAECRACHTDASGEVLGWSTRQLSRWADMGGTGLPVHQIEALRRAGVLDNSPANGESAPSFPAYGDMDAGLEDRARAYLHSNCAHCHRPGTSTTTPLDLRADTALGEAEACGVPPEKGELGLSNPMVIAPGVPDQSVLLARMETLDSNDRMPNLSSNVVDTKGVELIRAWIETMEGCP